MELRLIRAGVPDARELWQMQKTAFAQLLERYQDFETSPAAEPLERTVSRLEQDNTYYYYIFSGEAKVGAVRVVVLDNFKRISPIFILPEYRGRGYAQRAIRLCEQLHGSDNWELETIAQEPGNCHLYEKLGYVYTGHSERINDNMTLILYRK